MIPVALLLWKVVIKPLVDWWKGVDPAGKAIKASENKEDPTSDVYGQDQQKGPASQVDQSNVRYRLLMMVDK